MLRRVSRSAVSALPLSVAARNYNFGLFVNPTRVPQLTPEQRDKVVINQDEWPAEFKNFDPEDPYKGMPAWIEGMSTLQFFTWGMELGFLWHFTECVFIPKGL
jgi:hypothetical protein